MLLSATYDVPSASIRASQVRGCTFRKATLIFEKASSILHFAVIESHAATMCLWNRINRTLQKDGNAISATFDRAKLPSVNATATATMRRLMGKINLLVGGGAV